MQQNNRHVGIFIAYIELGLLLYFIVKLAVKATKNDKWDDIIAKVIP